MLVVMSPAASEHEVARVVQTIVAMGYQAQPIPAVQRMAVGVIGSDGRIDSGRLEALPGVLQVVPITRPYKRASREWCPEPTVVELGNGTRIGGSDVALVAGPCSVESREQILDIAHRLRASGATVLRGGAFKPRSSPYTFQGLGHRGLDFLAEARTQTGLAVVTEALDSETVDAVAECADIIQIGSRNMQNSALLRRAGQTGKPILLKRGMAATIDELLLSAEYILAEGNPHVILCERGIRGFDGHTRNVLDVAAVPVIHQLSHLPVIVDPSHATGARDKVIPMALASVAAGADGLMIEVHPDPDRALSDGVQSLRPDQFDDLVGQVKRIAAAIGRNVASALPAEVT
jgi:3-deoxy-7-phosphoheptulonate synthase